MKNIFITLCVLVNIVFSQAMAQENGDDNFAQESIKDISTVAGLGAGGAILGLSTLSFVEEPGDHLKNIVVGGAIGIIIGVGVVAWSQANKSRDLYETNVLNYKNFSTDERKSWHTANNKNYHNSNTLKAPRIQYKITF